MSGKFEPYSDNTEMVCTTEHEVDKYSFYRKKEEKGLKKLIKLAKKRNKLLEQIAKQQEMEKVRDEKEKSGGIKDNFKEFGRAFCKAFCKALPIIMTSLAGRMISWIFKGKADKKGLQFA